MPTENPNQPVGESNSSTEIGGNASPLPKDEADKVTPSAAPTASDKPKGSGDLGGAKETSTSKAIDWSGEDTTPDKKSPPPNVLPAYHNDAQFFRLVIYFAGWTLILSVGGMLILAQAEKEIPQGVVAASSGLVGLLTGIFAAKSSQAA